MVPHVIDTVIYPLQFGAFQIKYHGILKADGDKYGLVALLTKVGQGQVLSDGTVEPEFYPKLKDCIDLLPEYILWQPKAWNPGPQHSSRQWGRLENRYLVSEHGKIVSGRQSGRTGTHDSNTGKRFLGTPFFLFGLPKP